MSFSPVHGRTVRTIVNGAFLATKAFLNDLKQATAGRVINITSGSYWTPQPPFVGYISTKGALNGFTHVLGANLANYDVTVNAVAPSLVRPATALRSASEEFFTATVPMQDLKRSQKPTPTHGVIYGMGQLE